MIEPSFERVARACFGERVAVLECRPLSGGFVGDTFLVTLDVDGARREYVIKRSADRYEASEKISDKLVSALESEAVNRAFDQAPQTLGTWIERPGTVERIQPLAFDDHVWQVQEKAPGLMWRELLLERARSRPHLTDEERQEVRVVMERVHALHRRPLPSMSEHTRQRLYRRSMRDVLTHPEMTLAFIQHYLRAHPVFTSAVRDEYVRRMWGAIEHFDDHHVRLAYVHGDFWGANVLMYAGQPSFIDISRIGMGDPGMDVGSMYMTWVWQALASSSDYFLELAQACLAVYQNISGDQTVMRTGVLSIGFMGVAVTGLAPAPDAVKRRFLDYIMSCLEVKRLLSFSL